MSKNIILVLVILAVFVTTPTLYVQFSQAQSTPIQQWEYTELTFSSPVTFSSPIGITFYINGNPVQPNDPNSPVINAINSQGIQGWELVAVLNNGQSYIFKRPVQ